MESFFKSVSPKVFQGTIFFLELYFGETLLKKDSKIIVRKKKLELCFGETFLKKDSKTIVPKKKELYTFF